jgi:hypothetical protein
MGRHPATRLYALWIQDPSAQIANSIRQHSGRNRGATGEMSQIRPDARVRNTPADGMAHHTGVRQENLLTVCCLGVIRLYGALRLACQPAIELLLRLSDHVERTYAHAAGHKTLHTARAIYPACPPAA